MSRINICNIGEKRVDEIQLLGQNLRAGIAKRVLVESHEIVLMKGLQDWHRYYLVYARRLNSEALNRE